MRQLALLLVVAALAGCGGARRESPPPPPPPVEEELRSTWRLARFSLERRQYAQAAALYERVLERAYLMDDEATIGEVAYELAVVRLRLFEPRRAAELAALTRAERRRRGLPPLAELALVEAVARHELGEADAALQLAAEAEEHGADDPLLVARVRYLRGQIAAERGDVAELARMIGTLAAARDPELRGHHLELTGRRQLLAGDFAAAARSLRESAELRQVAEDFTGMARALALAAEATRRAGDGATAADLYLRAGRSAQVEGNRLQAEAWLRQARELAQRNDRPILAREARDLLRALAEARATSG
jgi:hypothetical protein